MYESDIGLDSLLVNQMVAHGLPFSVSKGAIYVDGFYKSWAVRLEHNEGGTFTAYARWDDVQQIADIRDLIAMNLKWQEWSSNRGVADWECVSEPWASLAASLGVTYREDE